MPKYSLNFRGAAGSWGETGTNGVVLADLYPATIAGLTCGWSTIATTFTFGAATNAKLSGRNSLNTGTAYFRVDLPNGPGTYRLWLALGTITTTANVAAVIRDGAGAAIATLASLSVPGSATPASANVRDASGAIVSYNDYISTDGGTYIEFTAVNDHIRIERNGITHYIVNVQLEPQATPLVDAVLSTKWGTGVHSGAIFSKQPQGYRYGKLTAASGTQSFSVVAGGTYFTTEVDGANTWLVATGTRVPDAWSGTVTVRQTSGADTRDTNFVLTAGTFARPVTGFLGLLSTETLIERKRTRDVVTAEEWPGYAGQAFAADLTANSPAAFATALSSITPDGTSWYRIRLQNGTWTGVQSLSTKDFGTGGLLIEPDAGHNPLLACNFTNAKFRRAHWRNLTAPLSQNGAGNYLVSSNSLTAPYTVMRFTACNFGHFFDTSPSISNWANFSDVISVFFHEQIVFEDCTYDGVSNGMTISGGRLVISRRANFRRNIRDFHAISTAYYYNTPRGVFADDRTYVLIEEGNAWFNPDIYAGLATNLTPHSDWLQIRRTGGAAYPTTSAGVNGSSTTPWVVGNEAFNPTINKLYVVTAVTGDGLINPASPPTGTGTGIVSGNVTFNYLQDYTIATEMVMLLENNAMMQDGVIVNQPGNAQPNVQFFINSNAGWNNTYSLTAINNISASSNIRGIAAGSEVTVFAERNTFAGGAQKILDNDQALIDGNSVTARHNIVGVVSGAPNVTGTQISAQGNIGVDWKNGAVSPFRPADQLVGPFDQPSPGTIGWGYTDFVDDASISGAVFRSNLSKRLHHKTGIAGAKLREVHTVTLSGTGGPQDFELVVAP